MHFTRLPCPYDIDRISLLNFSAPANDMLVASSYDSTTLFFSCSKNLLLGKISLPVPILDTTLANSKSTFAGLLDGTVRYIDFENTKVSSSVLGLSTGEEVSSGINRLEAVNGNQIIATSFSGNIYRIDERTHRVTESKNTGGKIFAMDASHGHLSLAKSQETVEIYDLRHMTSPMYTKPSGLRFQTTCLRHFPSGKGYALSSIDGRVSIEYFKELPDAQSAKYAFKCHRTKNSVSGIDDVYPVTGLNFHPRYETLFTSGGDGNLCVWNWARRKRMKVFPVKHEPFPRAISHMDINSTGTWLALGISDSSYGRSIDVGHMKRGTGTLLIKQLLAQDCEPKELTN